MRYLWLTRATPYPPHRSGDVAYSRGLIQHLAGLAQLHVLSLKTAQVDIPSLPGVAWTEVDHRPASRQASVLSPLPNVARRNQSETYLAKAVASAAGAAAIVIDNLAMAWCVRPIIRALGPARPPIVMVNHNFETAMRAGLRIGASSPAMKTVLTVDGWKAARLERRVNLAADGLTAITSTDLEAFRDLAPGRPALLLMPGYDGARLVERVISPATPRRVSIIGGRGVFYKKMVLLNLLRVLQAAGLQERLTIDIVGGGMDAEMRGLRAGFPGFNFIGYVDDLAGYLQTSRLGLIADNIGGGFKVRALDHVFQRLPMLALETSLQGMPLRPGIDFFPASALAEFPVRVLAVVDDEERLNAVQDAAYGRCATMFDWGDRVRDFHRFVQDLRAGRGEASSR